MKTPLVIFSSQDWDDLPTRKHRFAKAFSADGNPVLFIEAPFTYLSRFADKSYKSKIKKAGSIKQVSENLWVASPPAVAPFYGRYKFAQNKACNKLVKFTKNVLEQISFPKEFVTLFYLPWMNPIREQMNPKVSVYDCVDDHTGYGGTQSPKFLDKAEGELTNGCSVVFATAKFLADKLREFNSNTIYLPNAVDPQLFKLTAEAEEIKDIPKPRVVYAGALRWWFDSDLMHEVAKSLPEVSFIIIGGERRKELGENGINLRNLPNVFFLGRKPQEKLPGFMSGSCCGIIPFKHVELTKSVSPLKLYEYAGVGLPTISVPMSELSSLPPEVVTIAENTEEFISAIKKTIKTKPDVTVLKDFVEKNSWSSRIDKFTQELKALWVK